MCTVSMKFVVMPINGVQFVMKTQILTHGKLVTCFQLLEIVLLVNVFFKSAYICVHVFPLQYVFIISLVMGICLEFSIHSMRYSLCAVICLALPPIMNKYMMFICYAYSNYEIRTVNYCCYHAQNVDCVPVVISLPCVYNFFEIQQLLVQYHWKEIHLKLCVNLLQIYLLYIAV